MLKEWPLVAFTIAGQAAVGIFLFAGLPLFLSAGAGGNAAAHEARLVVLAVVLGLLAVAALLSLFHLHHPFRARRVLANFRTSWLSREILFELGFMALVSLGLFLVWSGWDGTGFMRGIMIAAALLGVLFILSMSKLYMLPSVPIWNQAYTPLAFALTALNLGAMVTALVLRFRDIHGDYSIGLLEFSFFCVGGEILLALFIAPRHGFYGFRPGPSLRPPDKTPRLLHWGRLTFLAAGLFFLGLALYPRDLMGSVRSGPGSNGLLAMALVLVLAGEVAGRFLFYGLLARPGR